MSERLALSAKEVAEIEKDILTISKPIKKPSFVDKVPAASKPTVSIRPLFEDPISNTKEKELVRTTPRLKLSPASRVKRTLQPSETSQEEQDANRKRNILIVVVLLAVVALVLFIYKRKKRNAKKG